MIFQANQEDEVFFDIGKGFQSKIPEKGMVSHYQSAPFKKTDLLKDQTAPKVLGSNNSADEVHFNVESRKITKPDAFQKEHGIKNSQGSRHQSGQVIGSISAIYFSQSALEPTEVLVSGKEEEVNYNSGIEADQTVRQETREAAMDSPRKDRSTLGAVRKMENANQSIVSPKESIDGKAASSSPVHENDSMYPSNIFDQIKERFNDFHNTLNETKPSQRNLKSPEIIGLPTSGIPESRKEAIAENSSEQDNGSSSDLSSPKVDLPDFKAYAGETVTAAGYRIVSLAGHAEQEHQAQLEQFLDKVMYQGSRNLLFDMSKLVSMNSSGWGVMVSCLQRLKKHGGTIVFCAMDGEVRQCFRVLELDKLFLTYNSVFEALRSIKQGVERPTDRQKQFAPHSGIVREKPENVADLPLDEKIQRIIIENPDLSILNIGKKLKSDEYGNVSLGIWALQTKLRILGLGTKEERHRFFRSS